MYFRPSPCCMTEKPPLHEPTIQYRFWVPHSGNTPGLHSVSHWPVLVYFINTPGLAVVAV
jgi:hypothetical protein